MLYVYLIAQTTLNIVAYKFIDKQIAQIDSGIGELEFEYILLKNKIDFDLALSLGYAEPSDIKFVNKDIVGEALSLAN